MAVSADSQDMVTTISPRSNSAYRLFGRVKSIKTRPIACAALVNASCTCGADLNSSTKRKAVKKAPSKDNDKSPFVVVVREADEVTDDEPSLDEDFVARQPWFVENYSAYAKSPESDDEDPDYLSLPPLSPTRPPLFGEDSDDEFELAGPLTPLSMPSSRRPSSTTAGNSVASTSLASTSARRKTSLASISTTLHPLSPPERQSVPVAWEPPVRLSQPSSRTAPLAAIPRTASLLTKSLKSLGKLPNLQLIRPTSSSLGASVRTLFSDGFSYNTSAPWSLERDQSASSPLGASGPFESKLSIGRRLAGLYDEPELATHAVQLETFSSPVVETPPSTPQLVLAPLPAQAPPSLPPSAPPSVTAPSPSPPRRYISNPAHLLMLSLEISMMERGKIVRPLKQRGVVFRDDTSILYQHQSDGDDDLCPPQRYRRSSLRYQVAIEAA